MYICVCVFVNNMKYIQYKLSNLNTSGTRGMFTLVQSSKFANSILYYTKYGSTLYIGMTMVPLHHNAQIVVSFSI